MPLNVFPKKAGVSFEKQDLAWVLELWLDSFGQLLAQFYTPLVIGVDVPNHLNFIIMYT